MCQEVRNDMKRKSGKGDGGRGAAVAEGSGNASETQREP